MRPTRGADLQDDQLHKIECEIGRHWDASPGKPTGNAVRIAEMAPDEPSHRREGQGSKEKLEPPTRLRRTPPKLNVSSASFLRREFADPLRRIIQDRTHLLPRVQAPCQGQDRINAERNKQ